MPPMELPKWRDFTTTAKLSSSEVMHARARTTVASPEVLDRLCLPPPHTRAHTILCFISDGDRKHARHTFVVWQGAEPDHPGERPFIITPLLICPWQQMLRLLRTHSSAAWCSLSMFHFTHVARAPAAYRISGYLCRTQMKVALAVERWWWWWWWITVRGVMAAFHFAFTFLQQPHFWAEFVL